MPHLDPDRLRREQYASANNLNARRVLHERFSTNPYGWQRWVFDHLLNLAPKDLIEIGCGPGALWQGNLDRLPPSWRVTLSDFSPGMVDTARRALPPGPFRYAVLDAERIALAASGFDCAIANHMLYHVADRPAALREVARVLRPGGVFIAATNGESHLIELNELAQRHGFEMELLDSAPFTLQNGEQQLHQVFRQVICKRYDDSLRVTDAETLVAYIRSLADTAASAPMDGLRSEIENRIRHDGCFAIRKEAGLFVASAPRR